MRLTYEWDEAKRQANLRKHGLDFAAVADLEWDQAKVIEDTRFAYPERRYVATVPDSMAQLFIVVFTPKTKPKVRVISFRAATDWEIANYG
jgi:uncharacterized DUF497 family protein